MWTRDWINLSPGIVSRLRLTFAMVAAALAIITSIGFVNLRGLGNTITNLTASTITTFVEVEETERSLTNLVILLQQVDRADSAVALAPLSMEIADRLNDLRAKATSLGEIAQTKAFSQGLTELLSQFEKGVEDVIVEKSSVLAVRATLAAQEQLLRDYRGRLRERLERSSFGISSNVSVLEDQGSLPSSVIEQEYSLELLRSSAFTTMVVGVDSIADKALSIRSLKDDVDIQDAANAIWFQLRATTNLLTRIEDDASRTALAKDLVGLKDSIFGEVGLIASVAQLNEHERTLATHVENQTGPLARISQLAKQLTDQQRAEVRSANAEVKRASRFLILSLGSATLGALVAIAAATYFIVERQINDRMSKLTTAVLAIAGGTPNYAINVGGDDEIGKMAKALEVFKSNAAELDRSNKELERFAYVAAHDLRSPLRAIRDLSDWIKEDEESVLSDDSKNYVALLVNRVERMNSLLTDLLDYSRVGHEETLYDQVSMPEVVAEIAELLSADNRFEISYLGDVDQVVTLVTPLRRTLQNLIANCIKHHDRDKGVINVRAERRGERLHCVVQDDGPGIEPQYQDRVFQLFQTLRSRDEVEGSGLGLAIVRKLVEHYGGSISIQSQPAQRRGTPNQTEA